MKGCSFIVIIIALMFIGCSSDGDASKTPNISITISGYVEDDPIPNAIINVIDSVGNIVNKATADVNGLYTLKSNFENNKLYYIEANGTLEDRNISMHSVFSFDANNTNININPLTELKYQLVKNDGKTSSEAEALIREYFNISNGKQLENNRFPNTDTIYIGMKEIAEIYNKTLSIDAISKIKEDILRNASLDENVTKEYSFRSLVRKELMIEATSNSLEVGESVTIDVADIAELNKNYNITWSGLPDDATGSDISKTFTISDSAQDVFVGVSLYKVEGDISLLKSSATIKVNFYEKSNPQNINLSTNEVNVSISEDVTINIPSDASISIPLITYTEINTNSDDYLKVFTLEPSGATFTTPLEIRIKYNPSIVYDPRQLVVKRVSSDGLEDILKVKDIDYENSELIFETDHFSKFIIEKDLNVFSYGDTSLEKWNENGKNDEITINGVTVDRKYSPYHYLVESLNNYCSKANIDNSKCQEWLKYFNNIENAKKIEDDYKKFFNLDGGNSASNYEIFNNDYFTWGLTTVLPEFPGEKFNGFGNRAKDSYDYIHALMLNRTLENTARDYSFFRYLALADTTGKNLNLLKYDIPYANIVSYINDIASLSSNIYDGLNDNKFREDGYIIYKEFSLFIVNKLINKVPVLGGVYSKLVNLNVDLLDSFEGAKFSIAFQKASRDNESFDFDRYFHIVTHTTDVIYTTGSMPKYSVDISPYGVLQFLIDDEIVSENKSVELLSGIINFDNAIAKGMANNNLAQFYLILKNYSLIKYNENYRNEIKNYTLLQGAKVALQILKYANKVSASELLSDKNALIKKFLERNSKSKGSLSQVDDADFVQVPVLESFDTFLEQININIPESLFNSLSIKKISLEIEKTGINNISSTSTVMQSFELLSSIENYSFSINDIDTNTFSLENGKYSNHLSSIFSDIDTTLFQNNYLAVKVKILLSIDGVDQIVAKDYNFLSYIDSNNELIDVLQYCKLSGSVKSALTGQPITNAQINIIPINTTTYSDGNGNFTFSKIPPNNYDIKIFKDGYKTALINNISLEIGEIQNIEILIDAETTPKITGFSPTTATQNATTVFTITGENLPDTIAMSLQDAVEDSCDLLSHSETSAVMSCVPGSSGEKFFYVADMPNGNAITSEVPLVVTVAIESIATGILVPSETTIDFGNVAVGDFGYSSFGASNTGNTQLKNIYIRPLSGDTTLFEFATYSIDQIEAGKGYMSDPGISFTPTQAGNHSAVFEIGADGIAAQQIHLTGTGITNEAPPKITGFSPITATQNATTVFTITGENLPDTIAMSLQDAVEDSCDLLSHSETSAVMSCIPGSSGEKFFYVADRPNGTAITSEVSLGVTVTSDDSAPDFSNSCYQWPTNVFDKYGDNWYECTRYAFGRSCEVAGVELTFTINENRHGGKWYDIVDPSYQRGLEPRANSLAVWKYGEYGHVAFVESVDGDTVTISESNWDTDATTAVYNGQKQLTTAQMAARGASSQYVLAGYVYLTQYPTITLADINPVEQGQDVTFTANLSESLDNQYSLKLRLGDGGGGYLPAISMDPNGARDVFSYSDIINTAGNRVYQVAIFSGDVQMTTWIEGTYIITEEVVDNPPTLTINTSGSGGNRTSNFNISVTATDDIGLHSIVGGVYTSGEFTDALFVTDTIFGGPVSGKSVTKSYAIDVDSLSAGSYELRIQARDAEGQKSPDQSYYFTKPGVGGSDIILGTSFPDHNFAELVQGEMDNSEVTALSDIPALNGAMREIIDTTGIDSMTGLTFMNLSSNHLDAIDISNNNSLIYILISYNQISTIDLSSNTALSQLSLDNNELSTIDLISNTALTQLYLGYNQLSTIDLRNNTVLIDIDLENNQLNTIDLSNNTALEWVSLRYNQLRTIDVSNNIALRWLGLSNNQLSTIDVSNNIALEGLGFYGNQLNTIDVSRNTTLTSLVLGNNQLSTIDVSRNTALRYLDLGDNQLRTIDVSRNTALTVLYLNDNQLSTIDVSSNSALTHLDIRNNPLTDETKAYLDSIQGVNGLTIEY